MPITLMVLTFLWKLFSSEKTDTEDAPADVSKLASFPVAPFIIGLLAGMLPLIHLHSLVVLYAFLSYTSAERHKE